MDVFATGQDVWLGKLGHFCIILGFVSAVIASISFWANAIQINKKPSAHSWKKLGQVAFIIHGFSVFSIIVTLFFMMATKKYIFSYVYSHASNDLPFQYLFAAFWEGQEGSTLLWTFWHVVLGFIILFTTKKWQSPVLGTVALVQSFLLSMVLGVYILEHKIGISPFSLLRSTATNAPIFLANPNFVPQDGKGLNELLRNYWMVIHPPTVFLGFASITIPFGFALGGLLWRDLKDWITPALPWTLLACAVLGIGVLMGGAWAYEALSFGGFWAWDPVENASLVPWLVIVSALHLMLIFRTTGYSGITTFLLIILSFILVAYSTFLTKSGVLGEASVHSFTDLGMSGQLVIFILFFWIFSFFLLLSSEKMRFLYLAGSLLIFIYYLVSKQTGYSLFSFFLFSFAMVFSVNDFPKKEEEEKLWSREFWLFIGSLVLLLSASHIILATSTPVYNKLFDQNYNIFDQSHFNSVQIWAAVSILFLSGVVLYFSYQKQSKLNIVKHFGISIIGAIILAIIFIKIYKFNHFAHILFLFASLFSIFSNGNYLLSRLRGKISIGGSTIAHIGFAILMLGIIVSQSKEKIISKNFVANVNVTEENKDMNENNVLLYENEPKQIGDYSVTLQDDIQKKLRNGVNINFKKINSEKNNGKEFQLTPKFKAMDDETLVVDPAIRRGIFSDFFTHISLINLGSNIDSTSFVPIQMNPQDTVVFDRMVFILDRMDRKPTRELSQQENDIPIAAHMRMITKDTMYNIEPIYLIRDNAVFLYPDEIPEEKIEIQLSNIAPDNADGKIEIGIKSSRPFKKYILLKIIVFPLINLVWLGSILMFFGFIISLIDRRKQSKKIA